MIMIEIAPLTNGAHRNQTAFVPIPDGWAVIPEDMALPNFPFGEIETELIGGVMTVTKWIPLPMPIKELTPTEKRKQAYETGSVDGQDYRVTWLDKRYTTDALTQLGMQYQFRGETAVAMEIQSVIADGVATIREAFPEDEE